MRSQKLEVVGALTLVLVAAALATRPFAQTPMGVMTFNIRTSNIPDGDNAWDLRRDLVAGTIERFAPQIAGLQKVVREQIEFLETRLRDYRWLGIDRGLNNGEGLSEYTPIFYRHRELTPIESGNFWLSQAPDLSTTPDNVWRDMTTGLLHDAWLMAPQRRGPAATMGSFGPPRSDDTSRIDWILVGPQIGVRSIETVLHNDHGRYPSDHFPVFAQIDLMGD